MDEQTLDASPPPSAAPAALGAFRGSVLGEWRHSLVVLDGLQPGRRIDLGVKPLVIGRRTAAAAFARPLAPGRDTLFVEDTFQVPPGSRLHLFKQGAFDFTDSSGRVLTLDDFEALLACLPPAAGSTPEQAFAQSRRLAASSRLDGDFLLLQGEFTG
jgi:hypothetical protein